ncbi:MAG: hypothetical protein IPJ65_10450 [Archangiaceae bacterium]|nr:hypothetical protein [Archangiaceae bacterium]
MHGVEGLVVADASVIPTNLGVNPQHTIMGLAQVFAEELLARNARVAPREAPRREPAARARSRGLISRRGPAPVHRRRLPASGDLGCVSSDTV